MTDFLMAIRAERSRREALADLAKHLLVTSIKISIGDGDEHELKLAIRYDATPGVPETGRRDMGDPHDYDPGSPPEVAIRAIRIFDGDVPILPPAWLERIVLANKGLRALLVQQATGNDA